MVATLIYCACVSSHLGSSLVTSHQPVNTSRKPGGKINVEIMQISETESYQ